MADFFSKKTFDYFDHAFKNRKNKSWFERHKMEYIDHVREPLANLITRLQKEIGPELRHLKFDPKKISQPLFRTNRIPEDGTIIKPQSFSYLSEKPTSLFESNPGIYLSVGKKPEDNIIGIGLYMVSGRQMSLLRTAIATEYDEVADILENKKLKKICGALAGEKYKKFPRGFNQAEPYAKYLWHKQFYLGTQLSRKDVISKKFFDQVTENVETSLPFLNWVTGTVGSYRRTE